MKPVCTTYNNSRIIRSVGYFGLCGDFMKSNRLKNWQFRGLSTTERFMQQVEITDSCWIWKGCVDKDGYGQFKGIFDSQRVRTAHRFSYVLFKGEIQKGLVVMHSCDNPSCVNPEHLSIGTIKDNLDDMRAKGRENFLKGEECNYAKLTEEKVKSILKDPRPFADIANDFEITVSTVNDIKRRKSWKHIDEEVVRSKKSRSDKGAGHYKTKLTDNAVREIRTSTESGKALAERFGITPQTICDIRKRRSWAHVTD